MYFIIIIIITEVFVTREERRASPECPGEFSQTEESILACSLLTPSKEAIMDCNNEERGVKSGLSGL